MQNVHETLSSLRRDLAIEKAKNADLMQKNQQLSDKLNREQLKYYKYGVLDERAGTVDLAAIKYAPNKRRSRNTPPEALR